jgi:hypothetical protein
MQSNLPSSATANHTQEIEDQNEIKSSGSLIQKSGASALKQKLLLKKIADNLARPRDAQEVILFATSIFL